MTALTLGVCSWAIDRHDVLRAIEVAGSVQGIQALQVGFFTEESLRTADPSAIAMAARDAGIALTSSFLAFEDEDYGSIRRIAETGGFGWDEVFEKRLAIMRDVAALTVEMACPAVAMHVGTIPPDSTDPVHVKLVERTQLAADLLTDHKLALHVETGREPAETLLRFLEEVDRPHVGVNFDPGNFVIYGTDHPVDAFAHLNQHIKVVHLKDAVGAMNPGRDFGRSAPLGTGEACIARIVGRLRALKIPAALLIECSRQDAGEQTVRSASEFLRSMLW